MYKLLLSWRYLRTRYIALASIVSVTLGVGTLIVVNSVMAGFAHEMHVRLKGILSDIVFESHSLDGFANPEWHKQEILKAAGDDIIAVTMAVHTPAIVGVRARGQTLPRQVMLIGVDEATYGDVSQFREYLIHAENRRKLSFQLREDGYGDKDHLIPPSGWQHRRAWAIREKEYLEQQEEMHRESQRLEGKEKSLPLKSGPAIPKSFFAGSSSEDETEEFDKSKEQHTGAVLGIAIGCIKQRDPDGKVKDYYLCRPGDDVQITFAGAGDKPQALSQYLTVVDFYESKMSEYDSGFVFMPLKALQDARGMGDAVTTIQLKLRPGADLNAVRDKLRARFPAEEYPYRIQTWKDMQGPLLSAVQMETTLLNILLFLIIAVAGFGILATFFMIVVEKTKDIGILKALGAPSRGVMSIFLSYGFSLGLVGSGAGMIGGLLFVFYINDIAKLIEWFTGHEVFDPTVYYFSRIPTIIEPTTVLGVVCGAVLIAVMASVLPALRAARLHPVQALRYE